MTSATRRSDSPSRIAAFWASSVGKKIVMGTTGFILVAFVIFHMAGNLQVFLGRDVFNRYSEILHTSEEALWIARIVLLVSAVLHVIAAYQLTMRDRAARPADYAKRAPQVSTFASRFMRIGGVVILVFIPLHLLNFTTGDWHPDFDARDVYGNVIYAFESWPLLAVFYLIATAFVGFHLYHGIWAMLRTLGVAKPSARPLDRTFIAVLTWVVTLGFAIIPAAIVLGLVR